MEHRGEDEDDMTRGTNDAGERATTGAARGAPSRRADAVRNRASIIRATRRLVTERGTDAAMGEIAKAAGVAVGTQPELTLTHHPKEGRLHTQTHGSRMD